jgi:hypothetical protein
MTAKMLKIVLMTTDAGLVLVVASQRKGSALISPTTAGKLP